MGRRKMRARAITSAVSTRLRASGSSSAGSIGEMAHLVVDGGVHHVTDAVVIGSGPNGLAAAVRLAQAGLRVLVLEGADEIGGGTRSAELTVPGLIHDVCSAVHPFGAAPRFWRPYRWPTRITLAPS